MARGVDVSDAVAVVAWAVAWMAATAWAELDGLWKHRAQCDEQAVGALPLAVTPLRTAERLNRQLRRAD
eukprot:3342895-Pleurochrysis_carterae.AAC.2